MLRKIIALILSLSFLLATTSPALASYAAQSAQLVMDNQTDERIDILLRGPISVINTLEPGKNRSNLPVGTYAYSYKACGGKNFRGSVNLTAGGATLKLPACSAGSGDTESAYVVLENRSTTTVKVTLTGTKNYSFSVSPGNLKVEIDQGNYKYSYSACGATKTGKLVAKAGVNTLTIPKCSGSGRGNNDDAETAKPVNLIVVNGTGAPLRFVLTGPYKYTFTAKEGKTKISVLPGVYQFTMTGAACRGGKLETGTITSKANGTWVWSCK